MATAITPPHGSMPSVTRAKHRRTPHGHRVAAVVVMRRRAAAVAAVQHRVAAAMAVVAQKSPRVDNPARVETLRLLFLAPLHPQTKHKIRRYALRLLPPIKRICCETPVMPRSPRGCLVRTVGAKARQELAASCRALPPLVKPRPHSLGMPREPMPRIPVKRDGRITRTLIGGRVRASAATKSLMPTAN